MRQKLFSVTKSDLDVQTFCSGGPGGQHQNKTESGVRLVHRESGAVGESRSERSQVQNKRLALQRLSNDMKFKLWMKRKAHELKTGITIEQRVEKSMASENLKIEVHDESGKWVELGAR